MVQVLVDITSLRDALEQIEKIKEIAIKQHQIALSITCGTALISIEALIDDLKKFVPPRVITQKSEIP